MTKRTRPREGITVIEREGEHFTVDDNGDILPLLKELRKYGRRDQADALQALLKASGFKRVGRAFVIRGVAKEKVGVITMKILTSLTLLEDAIERASQRAQTPVPRAKTTADEKADSKALV